MPWQEAEKKDADSMKEQVQSMRSTNKEREVKKKHTAEATIQMNPWGMFLLLQSSSRSAYTERDWLSPEIAPALALSMLMEQVSVNTASTQKLPH